MLAPSRPTGTRGSCIVALLAFALLSPLVACSFSPGQQVHIRAYRQIDDRMLLVLSEVATPGYKTWLASVAESPASVILEARTRQTELGRPARGSRDLWLTVVLQAPLGKRQVIDAAAGARVFPMSDFPSM